MSIKGKKILRGQAQTASRLEEIIQLIKASSMTKTFLPMVYVMRCAIRYHLYNLKNMKNSHGGVLMMSLY